MGETEPLPSTGHRGKSWAQSPLHVQTHDYPIQHLPLRHLPQRGESSDSKGLSMGLDWPECLDVGVWAHSPSLRFPTRIKGFSRQVGSKGDWSTLPGWVRIRPSVALCPGGARHSSGWQSSACKAGRLSVTALVSDRLAAPVRSMQRSLFSLMLVQSKDLQRRLLLLLTSLLLYPRPCWASPGRFQDLSR